MISFSFCGQKRKIKLNTREMEGKKVMWSEKRPLSTAKTKRITKYMNRRAKAECVFAVIINHVWVCAMRALEGV